MYLTYHVRLVVTKGVIDVGVCTL